MSKPQLAQLARRNRGIISPAKEEFGYARHHLNIAARWSRSNRNAATDVSLICDSLFPKLEFACPAPLPQPLAAAYCYVRWAFGAKWPSQLRNECFRG